MNKALKLLKFLIGWPLSAISLFFVAKLILANSQTLNNLKNLNFVLLSIGILLFLVYFLLRSILWNEILKSKGNKFSFLKTAYLWEISEIKRYTPGNIWSFLSRTDLFSQTNIPKKDVAVSLFDEVILIILSCFTIASFYITYFLKNTLVTIFVIFLNLVVIIIYTLNKKFNFRFFPKLAYWDNFKLYAVSTGAFFAFGLATYFSAVSVVFLDPKNVLQLTGLFVFALIIGYLSIITPMGLGVREGITAFGLLKFTSAGNAGLVSVFTRIIFIISETIFLGIFTAFEKIKNKYLFSFIKLISTHKYEAALSIFISIYILYFTFASFLRYDNFYTGRFDLGNMDQVVWNTINGRIFQLTDPNGTNPVSRLSFHADFILILISPLYLIWSNPKMLLLLQTIVLSLGSIFIYLIARNILKNKNVSLVLSLSYLLYPALQFVNLYDFHPVALGTTFLLAAYYFFLKNKYLYFLIFAFLSAITKENVWAIISIFGIFIIFKSFKNKRIISIKKIFFGGFIFLFSAMMFYLLIAKIIPFFRGGEHFALSYYSEFGNTPLEVLPNILFNPLKTFSVIFESSRLRFLFDILSPLGFISLLNPVALIFAFPDILISLLSNNVALRQIYYQYTSSITPFIFISAIYSLRYLSSRFKSLAYEKLSVFILLSSLISLYFIGPIAGSKRPNIDMFAKQLDNKAAIEKFISKIPVDYSIAATNNLGSHLSQREKIYTIPVGIDKADVILFLLNDSFAQPSLNTQKETARQMRNDKNYLQVYKNGDFIAFEKKSLYIEPKPKPKKGQVNLFPYSITALINRSYQESDITFEKEVLASGNFKSYVISFISDGLKEYALMNVPNSIKPANGYPVIILNHGYVQPTLYSTINSYKTDTDYFANQGFLVIKPDYRGNANSEVADKALMRFAYPIDVLNLLASLKNVENADENNVFLWSHSMGGEVTLEVLEVISKNKDITSKVKAAAFWAPVTDPVKWFSKTHLPTLVEARITPYPYSQTFQILGTPEQNPELWNSISPLKYLDNINTPILLQHGTSDNTVPYSWSTELNADLLKINKKISFISYPNDDHNLSLYWSKAVLDDINFYNSFLK